MPTTDAGLTPGRSDLSRYPRGIGAAHLWLGAGLHSRHALLTNRRDPAVDFANIEQAEHWSQAAPAWLELEDQLEEVSRLPGELAMERLALGPGQRVVDLGCGSGMTTLDLASRVGPGGGAVGVDISAEMLARARERAALADSGTSRSCTPTSKCTSGAKHGLMPPTRALV